MVAFWKLASLIMFLFQITAGFNCVRRISPSARYSITRRYLNRIFFDRNELTIHPQTQKLVASLLPEDYRHKHIRDILKLLPGDTIKCGVLNQGLCDQARITSTSRTVDRENGGACIDIELCDQSTLQQDSSFVIKPRIDLILALPRPLRLEKILPVIACFGVNRLFLIKAEKVEADYFGSHLLRRNDLMRNLLIEGLSQASVDYHIPEVIVVKKNFCHWLKQLPRKSNGDKLEFDGYFPASTNQDSSNGRILKIIAHPPKEASAHHSKRMYSFFEEQLKCNQKDRIKHVVLAIGPEGGWEEEEVEDLRGKGFQQVDLGERILRTDMAVSCV